MLKHIALEEVHLLRIPKELCESNCAYECVAYLL